MPGTNILEDPAFAAAERQLQAESANADASSAPNNARPGKRTRQRSVTQPAAKKTTSSGTTAKKAAAPAPAAPAPARTVRPAKAPAAAKPPATTATTRKGRTAVMASTTIDDLFASATAAADKPALRKQAFDFGTKWDATKDDAVKLHAARKLLETLPALLVYLGSDIRDEFARLGVDITGAAPAAPEAPPAPGTTTSPANSADVVIRSGHKDGVTITRLAGTSPTQVRVQSADGASEIMEESKYNTDSNMIIPKYAKKGLFSAWAPKTGATAS